MPSAVKEFVHKQLRHTECAYYHRKRRSSPEGRRFFDFLFDLIHLKELFGNLNL